MQEQRDFKRTIAREESFVARGVGDRIQPIARSSAGDGSNTTSTFFAEPLLLLILQVMEANRIVYRRTPHFVRMRGEWLFTDHASISPADKEKITHLNAERLLRLEQA